MKNEPVNIIKAVPKDPVSRSDHLDKRLADMPNSIDKTVENLVKSGQRLQRLVNLVIVSIALEFMLIAGLGVLYLNNAQQDDVINLNQRSLIANCEAGNNFREDNLVLWKYIIALPPSDNRPPRTAEDQQRIDEFERFVERTFALRDCQNLPPTEDPSRQ